MVNSAALPGMMRRMHAIHRRRRRSAGLLAAAALAGLALAGCGTGVPVETNYPETRQGRPVPYPTGPRETVFGPDGVNFLDVFNGKEGGGGGGGGIGVNTYLWRASLDTINFMPLTSADPFGGVIITDWYAPPETPEERFKMTVYILDRQLRADGLKVAVFRQARRGADWVDAAVAAETGIELENAILTRARQLRVGTASN
jgi:hypothetical protein